MMAIWDPKVAHEMARSGFTFYSGALKVTTNNFDFVQSVICDPRIKVEHPKARDIRITMT